MSHKPNSLAGYKYLLSYQYSSVIYDFTVEFCQKFIIGVEFRRQRDQMIQAARSGKQNIVEGYELQSLENYIRFLGISKGSLKELLEDYEDFLRQHSLAIWPKDDPRMRVMREMRIMDKPFPHIPHYPHIPHEPTFAANLMVMLCQRTTYFLDKQILSLRAKFIQEGGFRENLFRERMKVKTKT